MAGGEGRLHGGSDARAGRRDLDVRIGKEPYPGRKKGMNQELEPLMESSKFAPSSTIASRHLRLLNTGNVASVTDRKSVV